MDRRVECWTSGMERRQSHLDPKSLDSSDERERDHKRGELVAFGGSTNLRSHGDADRSYRVWKSRAGLHGPEWAVVAWRHGPNVRSDERLSSCTLADACRKVAARKARVAGR